MLWKLAKMFSFAMASFLAFFAFQASAAMSSTNYQILWDAIGVGGSELGASSGGTYLLRDSIGDLASGESSSANYAISAGYRSGIYDPVVKIVYYIQDKNTEVAATQLVGLTVTVTITSDYSVGNFVVVVQDQGTTQVAAIGQIVSLTPTTITVDSWTDGGSSPMIDGSADYVYQLSGTSLPLGSLHSSVVTTGIVAWEATADVSQGYGVYVVDSGQPQTVGGDTLADVTDGVVSVGDSEYGGRSSDVTLATSTFDVADSAFTTTPQLVASRGDNTFVARDFLTIKAAISSTQPAGSYTSTVALVLVGDY